jgi:2-C-methyl-D-erythritol 4-phosphate cytidylyltransferase / 2-C-methyl-D-erythritol 2,4-cyclodiphosphate synthase
MRSSLHKTALIIPAAGSGERLGGKLPKALVQIAGRTLIEHAVAHLSPISDQIIIAAPPGFESEFTKLFGGTAEVVTGGKTRSESVAIALKKVAPDNQFILVHDAARALASTELGQRVIAELANGAKAVIPTIALTDTIKEVNSTGHVVATPAREAHRLVQTPQGFARAVLIDAHASGRDASDDAALVEALGIPVHTVNGEARALKITTPEDLAIATNFLIGNNLDLRSGIGVDSHAFAKDSSRKLWLAGLLWRDEIGLEGHSDGDVALHAICDALLSASGLGDLGSNFGTADPKYAGVAGGKLLTETLARVVGAGFEVSNVAVQIIGNRPKIGARRTEAIVTISNLLGGAPVSVSATTTDGLGLTGEGRGLSAIATAIVIKK